METGIWKEHSNISGHYHHQVIVTPENKEPTVWKMQTSTL